MAAKQAKEPSADELEALVIRHRALPSLEAWQALEKLKVRFAGNTKKLNELGGIEYSWRRNVFEHVSAQASGGNTPYALAVAAHCLRRFEGKSCAATPCDFCTFLSNEAKRRFEVADVTFWDIVHTPGAVSRAGDSLKLLLRTQKGTGFDAALRYLVEHARKQPATEAMLVVLRAFHRNRQLVPTHYGTTERELFSWACARLEALVSRPTAPGKQ